MSTAYASTSEVLLTSEALPFVEMQQRQQCCLAICREMLPKAEGILVFSRLAIYYLTGTWGGGALWLPHEAEPVLLVRKGPARCRVESPLKHIFSFRSFAELGGICAEAGSPLPESQGAVLAVEMGALPWALAHKLRSSMPSVDFRSVDAVLAAARSVKSAWELNKMRLAGARHNHALTVDLPALMRPGMSERALSRLAWRVFFALGHGGINRMGNFGEECFLGHIAAGDNGNYPSHFNGPLGLKGEHPAVPFMGNAHSLWAEKQILAMDIGFMLEGYHTDKTQVYWSGPASSIPPTIRKAHDACVEIQIRAAEALKVGAIPARIWEDALERARLLGVHEGFMGLQGNKVGFLGHGIGLVIDESPVLAPRFEKPLVEGMVLAIEPKVGLPGLGMVGVENTFEVTLEGGRSMTGQDFGIICVE